MNNFLITEKISTNILNGATPEANWVHQEGYSFNCDNSVRTGIFVQFSEKKL